MANAGHFVCGCIQWAWVLVHVYGTVVVCGRDKLLAVNRAVRTISMVNIGAIHPLLPNALHSPSQNTAVAGPVLIPKLSCSPFDLLAIWDAVIKKFVGPVICPDRL